jgi:hypothetical protein
MRSSTHRPAATTTGGRAKNNFANSQHGCNDSLTKIDDYAHRRTGLDITSCTAPKVSPTGETARGSMTGRWSKLNAFPGELHLPGGFCVRSQKRRCPGFAQAWKNQHLLSLSDGHDKTWNARRRRSTNLCCAKVLAAGGFARWGD